MRAARDKAPQRAEEALTRISNGLGGRYYKTKAHVDAKVAHILGDSLPGLLTVTTGETDHKPTLSFRRNSAAIQCTS